MSTGLEVTVKDLDGHTVVTARGDIFFDTVDPLRTALLSAAETDGPRIVLDLGDVRLCDSSGLNVMAHAQQVTARHDGWLRLAAVRPMVRTVLEATNLVRLLPIYESVTAATTG